MINDSLFYKKSFYFLALSLCLAAMLMGCGNRDEDKRKEQLKKIVTYFDLPPIGRVNKAEKERIGNEGQAWFGKYIENTAFAGGIIVAKDGEILYEKYTGLVSPNTSKKVDEHTAMHIASVSKTFTAMTVLHLAEQGKINIDSSFSYYFPAFNYEGVTVKTLLNHRSGLPNYPYFMEKLWLDKTKMVSNNDVLQFLIGKKSLLPIAVKADTRFSYCNTNYALLALLVEKVTQQPFPVYMKDSIFTPLRMEDTHIFVPSDTNKVTLSYTWRNEIIPFNFLDQVYGDKNIYSTPRDLLLWDRFLKSGLFLSDASLQAAYTPYSNERAGTKNYGLGWRMLLYPDNKNIVFHNGWWHGNTAAYIRLLDEGVTIIALNNRYSSSAYKAKLLANCFYPYFTIEPDDEDFQKEIVSDSLISPDSTSKKSNLKPKK